MKTRVLWAAALAAALLIDGSGCASRSNLPVYDSSQIGSVIKTQEGEIVAVRDVVIKAPNTPRGSTGMGSRIGSAVGRGVIQGGGTGAIIGAAGGVVGDAIGGVAGARMDDKVGEEITILVEGRTITVVQERSTPPLAPGERVKILTGSGSGGGEITRVIRAEQFASSSPARLFRY
jgi:outer membrane lipoprotein SlyB